MLIKTPSGYSVTLKDFLSFGEKREISKPIMARTKIKPAQGGKEADIQEMTFDFLDEMQDKAFGFLVQKIEIAGEEKTEGLYEIVMSWPEKDGQAVFDAIDKITNLFGENTEREKK